MAGLNELLNGFIRVRGVNAALVVGQDGLVLESVSAPGATETDVDVLGAMASSGLVPAQEIGQETGRGRLAQSIYEYERGVVVIEPVSNAAIHVVVTDAAANRGLL